MNSEYQNLGNFTVLDSFLNFPENYSEDVTIDSCVDMGIKLVSGCSEYDPLCFITATAAAYARNPADAKEIRDDFCEWLNSYCRANIKVYAEDDEGAIIASTDPELPLSFIGVDWIIETEFKW